MCMHVAGKWVCSYDLPDCGRMECNVCQIGAKILDRNKKRV